jgi:thiol-disulfide isomerase/thioredoxin
MNARIPTGKDPFIQLIQKIHTIMKKNLVHYLFMLALALYSLSGFAQGIEFNHSKWEEVKALAKKENKLIFIDFYTDWCAPCKYMAKVIFPEKEVGDFYNQHFICVKIDAEKGEGPALAKKYGVGGFPTLAFTNANEEIVYKVVGSADAKEFIDQGTLALTPRNDYAILKDKYEKNELGKEDLYRYLLLVKAKGDDKAAAGVFDKYFVSNAAISADMFTMIKSYTNDSHSPAFIYLEQHREEFGSLAGKDKVEEYIHHFIVREYEYKQYSDEAAYKTAIQELKTRVSLSEQEELNIDTNHYLEANDEDNYMKAATKLVKIYAANNNDLEISNILGGSMRLVKLDSNTLITKQWAQQALAIKDNSLNNATLALICKKLKDKTMALKYIDLSLAASVRDNDGYAPRIEMFKKEIQDAVY